MQNGQAGVQRALQYTSWSASRAHRSIPPPSRQSACRRGGGGAPRLGRAL